MRKFRTVLYAILTFLWLGVIYSFSLQPADASSETSLGLLTTMVKWFMPWMLDELLMLPQTQLDFLNHVVRKLAHFTEFWVLGVLTANTLQQLKTRYRWMFGIVFCLCAAITDEVLQLFVEGRAGQIGDVAVDGLGSIVGVLVVYYLAQRQRKHVI